uniref:Transporter n=1 Tax=Rhipicephalus appendiculatus TaxID=34631 RepID=A0A131YKJ9_RHIAP
MVVKRASLPNAFTLVSLRRSSCKDLGLPLEDQQVEPIFREADDNDRTSHASGGAGSQLDFSVRPRRGQWASKADFVFSCISYAVGLGNVWRFPYLCYENGGGAFLIPYFTCLLTTAVPMFYLEVAMGQYLSKGGIGVWAVAPMFKGIGIASLVLLMLGAVYCMVIVTWILFYLISSFATVLPWEHCGNYWNTDRCWEHNDTHPTPPHNGTVTPIVEFWENRVLGITSGLHEIGKVRPEIALYLFIGWAMVYLVIWRGLHQSGKIVWVSALFPYVCLLILLVRGVTLTGAADGLMFYIKPDWSQLLKPRVWIAAGTQVFYSYGVGFGSLMTLGSYNDFHQNFFRDSAIVCIVNPLTSLLSGTVIFSVLGHMAFLTGKTVGDVVKSGPGLAFLVYPEIVARMPASTIWSIFFFVMLLFLGINSLFCPSEAIVAGLIDQWPRLVTKRRVITFCLVVLQFLLGLPMTTEGGMYIFQLMDYYAVSGITLLFIVFFQAVALTWVYGTRNLSDNIKEMIGRRPILLLRLGWKVFIPAMCVAIFLSSVIRYQPLVYAKTYAYPWWAEMLGWFLSLSSIIMIPAYMIYFLVSTPGSLRQRIRAGLSPQLADIYHSEKETYSFSNAAVHT